MGGISTKEAPSRRPSDENGAPNPFAGTPNEGGAVLRALLDGDARARLRESDFVLEMGDAVVRIGDFRRVLRVARVDDPDLLEDFFASPAMSMKGVTRDADTLEEAAPELFSGLYGGTNVLQRVTQKELEAISHYTTKLYKGMNPLLRGDLTAYLDGAEEWLIPSREAAEEAILNALVAYAIVISSALNKLPDFTSRHNGSMANPQGYMFRGLRHCPESVRSQLTRCARSKGKVLFSDASFMSTSWSMTLNKGFRPERGGSGVICKVVSKTGSQIFHASAYAVEREVLFVPGTEFSVSMGGRDRETGAKVFILQEVVPH